MHFLQESPFHSNALLSHQQRQNGAIERPFHKNRKRENSGYFGWKLLEGYLPSCSLFCRNE